MRVREPTGLERLLVKLRVELAGTRVPFASADDLIIFAPPCLDCAAV
jgi:hypothetical protein